MLAATVLPAVCFATLVLVPRRRRRDIHRLVWLAVPITLVAALGPPHGEQSPVLLAVVALGALLVAVTAIALMPVDPRPAIAGAVALSTLGLGVADHEPFALRGAADQRRAARRQPGDRAVRTLALMTLVAVGVDGARGGWIAAGLFG